jgi:transcriptional regulator
MNPQDNPVLVRELAKKRAKAFELRAKGYSYGDIAQELGYSSESGAYKAVREARRLAVTEPVAEILQIELATLSMLQRKAIAALEAAKDGNLIGIDEVLAVMKRRSALLGLDAPKQVYQQVDVHALTSDDRARRKEEILALLAEAEPPQLSTGEGEAGETDVPDPED